MQELRSECWRYVGDLVELYGNLKIAGDTMRYYEMHAEIFLRTQTQTTQFWQMSISNPKSSKLASNTLWPLLRSELGQTLWQHKHKGLEEGSACDRGQKCREKGAHSEVVEL